MGGSIAVTVRRANGENIRMCKWTNTLPGFFKNIDWIDGKEQHLDEYLKSWYDRRAPDSHSDQSSRSEQFHSNRTPVYAPHSFLAPTGYGLVVIDYQTKTVLSMQGYSTLIELFSSDFDSLNTIGFFNVLEDYFNKEIHKHQTRIQRLLERGLVFSLNILDGKLTQIPDFETAHQLLNSKNGRYLRFFMQPDPWRILPFEESSKGVQELKKAVLELGFSLTDKEQALWSKFEQRYLED